MYLALADIYQYGLEDAQMAIECIEKYLKMKDDTEVGTRLEALQNAIRDED